MERMSLVEVAKRFSDEAAAWEYVEQIRWQGTPICPFCASTDVLYLQPRSGAPRTTRTGTTTYRRVWRCRSCRKQFSCLIGTIFEGSKIPLRKWVMAIYLMVAGKNGCSAMELQRDLEVTYKSAWFMVHRIREAMAHSRNGKMRGIIVADETWVGGDPGNKHSKGRAKGDGPNKSEKTTVLTLVNKLTGETRSEVVPNTRTHNLRSVIDANVEKYGSVFVTDAAHHYTSIGMRFSRHDTVNHMEGEYFNPWTGATTNHVENYFSLFKRSLDGTYHSVSKEHLGRYAHEFDFRASTRKMADGERAMEVYDRAVGAYISYQDLISSGPVARKSRPKPPGRPGPRQAKPSLLRPATEDAD